jgi:hypothetical protein
LTFEPRQAARVPPGLPLRASGSSDAERLGARAFSMAAVFLRTTDARALQPCAIRGPALVYWARARRISQNSGIQEPADSGTQAPLRSLSPRRDEPLARAVLNAAELAGLRRPRRRLARWTGRRNRCGPASVPEYGPGSRPLRGAQRRCVRFAAAVGEDRPGRWCDGLRLAGRRRVTWRVLVSNPRRRT